ncbi:MAG: hypothetical protein QOI58_3842 [Thermoanaerobaculia bacterium]|jgi:hypothetical protein|nr:hypothetical protein [Thermoanaerobaculia bacterium]
MRSDVIRIIEVLEFRSRPGPLEKKRLRDWFASDDPNVIGAAADAVLQHWEYIEPPLTRGEVGDVLMKNLAVSLLTRGQKVSDYAYNCHEAGKEFYVWVIAAQAALPDAEAEECLRLARQFLRDQYRSGDEGQRGCIITGVLEHLFEIDDVRTLFADWQRDPEMMRAFERAEAWSTWVAAHAQSLDAVTSRAAELLKERGFKDVVVSKAAIGTIMPAVLWENGEEHQLSISCDEEWLNTFKETKLNIEEAARFATNSNNWSQAALPTHFSVKLQGARFRIRPR